MPVEHACTAVGSFRSTSLGNQAALAERWNGMTWEIQSTPNPTATQNSFLNAVSCPSSTACTAVGNSQDSLGATVTLAGRWHQAG